MDRERSKSPRLLFFLGCGRERRSVDTQILPPYVCPTVLDDDLGVDSVCVGRHPVGAFLRTCMDRQQKTTAKFMRVSHLKAKSNSAVQGIHIPLHEKETTSKSAQLFSLKSN
jgi:hypothetical protein